MTNEQEQHLTDNIRVFANKYDGKYRMGQKEHGGEMWTMGAYQALENAEDEALDNWSYLRQIRKCLDDIQEWADRADNPGGIVKLSDLREILNRVKED